MQNSKSRRSSSAKKATAYPETSVRRGQTGTSILIIGGNIRPHAIDKLKRRHGIHEVHWLPTRKSSTAKGQIELAIRNKQPQLVVALYGLMRHRHSEYVRSECSRTSTKLLVRFRGVSPNAIKPELKSIKPAKEERA